MLRLRCSALDEHGHYDPGSLWRLQQASIQLSQGSVRVVTSFKYLGSLVMPQGSLSAELSRRLSLAGAAFSQLRKFFVQPGPVSTHSHAGIQSHCCTYTAVWCS
jgi:hypothetical protein